MFRKTISLALAICMVAVIFTGLNVSAQTLTGKIQSYSWDGATAASKDVFWQGDNVYFQLEFRVNGDLKSAPFAVRLFDSTWNLKSSAYVTTPNADLYNSWSSAVSFGTGALAAGTYYLAAFLTNTTQLLCTDSFTIRAPGIVLDPAQVSYAPGQTVDFNITVQYPGRINVTIGVENITWTNESTTDNSWTGSWEIPSSIKTMAYPLYVNKSTNNVPIYIVYINVQALTFTYTMDKFEYLPGETATVSWTARAVPGNTPMTGVSLDWNMSYRDAIDGKMKYQNVTETDGVFDVVLPANANVNWDINVIATAYIAYNQKNTLYPFISLSGLDSTVVVMPNSITVGQSTVVEVRARTANIGAVVEGANASVTVYDNKGVTTNLTLTGLKTDASGVTSGSIALPATLKAGTYTVTATVTKLVFTDMVSAVLTVNDDNRVDIIVDKNLYMGGDDINVKVETVLNGQVVYPAFIEYAVWLADIGVVTDTQVTTSSNFTIMAPMNLDSHAQVYVKINVGDKVLPGFSDVFEIRTLVIQLGALETQYYAGDTVTFEAKAIGESAGFDFSYSIWDNEGVAVVIDEALTLDENNQTTFELEIPSDAPAANYTARVVADNHAGNIVDAWLLVSWRGGYLLDTDIETGPAYSTGEFAPGQTITVGFTITKQHEDLPDFSIVRASVRLSGGEDATIATGEVKSFDGMSGEVTIMLPNELNSGWYSIDLSVSCDNGFDSLDDSVQIMVADNGNGWNSSVGGLSAGDFMMTILMVVVILMLLWQMMKGRGAGTAAGREKKPAEPKEAKQESYTPKATIACASCGSPIEVATSKRPIEVMCPKCGKSQMVN